MRGPLQPRVRPPTVPLVLTALSACGEWPRFANLPEDTGPAWPAGSVPTDQVLWTDAGALDTSPSDPAPIEAGEGWIFTGILEGSGADPGSGGGAESGCAAGDFPPDERGVYLGDTLWASLSATAYSTPKHAWPTIATRTHSR